MRTAFDGCGMIAVFPKGPLAVFPLIEFLAGATGNPSQGIRYRIAALISGPTQVNMVRCDRVVEDNQSRSPF
jgi:hypothetical protein